MPEPEERPRGRWLGNGGWKRWLLIGGAVSALLIAAAVVVVLLRAPHNVSHPDLSFTVPTQTTTTATTTTRRRHAARPRVDHFSWPLYGYTAARTRAFNGDANLRPPLRRGWTLRGNALLEFPPVIAGHRLYFMDDSANVKAVDTLTGRVIWHHKVGALSSASPGLSVAHGILVVPVLSDHGRSPGDGQVVALSMRRGAVLWSHPLASGAEGSPLVVKNTVFYGDQAGTVFSANIRTGHVNWTFQASGAVKGGAALSGDNLYVDDYGGHVYDINAHSGHEIWSAAANGGSFGFSSGTFYTTPAVAFGRVYVGNTSGYVYSFAASTGQLAWSYGTGAYVYGSAAVADVPGLGPTVYVGSYNGNFYAFNAQSGAIRWKHPAGGKISGSATIVGNVVYYSDLGTKTTAGLDVRTGHKVFSFPDGAFNPVVCDDTGTIYLSGYTMLYQMRPAGQ